MPITEKNNEIFRKAAVANDINFMDFLLRSEQADIHSTDKSGWNAFMLALESFKYDSAAYLLKKGININAQNKSSETALHQAVRSGDTDALKFLLEHGADIKIKNDKGLTASGLAKRTKNSRAVAFFESWEENGKLMSKIASADANPALNF